MEVLWGEIKQGLLGGLEQVGLQIKQRRVWEGPSGVP